MSTHWQFLFIQFERTDSHYNFLTKLEANFFRTKTSLTRILKRPYQN